MLSETNTKQKGPLTVASLNVQIGQKIIDDPYVGYTDEMFFEYLANYTFVDLVSVKGYIIY